MKTKTILLAILTGFTISSCSDFLTQLPETSVPKENFYKTEADFAQANIGIYQMLRTIYGAGAANYGSWMMGEMRSDNTTYLYNLENRGYADREYIALFTDDANGGAVSNKYNNTSILNFEGIGGGSGHDILIGNAYDNILLGGQGSDTLTGGTGADTFVWRNSDYYGGTDYITDFSLADHDKIKLQDLMADGQGHLILPNGSVAGKIVDGKLVIEVHHGDDSQDISVNITGSLNVNGTDYSDFNSFVDTYVQSGYDEDMLNALISQMLTSG